MIQTVLPPTTWMTQQMAPAGSHGYDGLPRPSIWQKHGSDGLGRPSHNAQSQKLLAPPSDSKQGPLREVFDDFVGQTFYGQMLGAMRKTVDKPAYFHGGRAEEVFQAQLDQTLAEKLADATAEQFTGPMFELFNMRRS
jgi:hypothetical protein